MEKFQFSTGQENDSVSQSYQKVNTIILIG